MKPPIPRAPTTTSDASVLASTRAVAAGPHAVRSRTTVILRAEGARNDGRQVAMGVVPAVVEVEAGVGIQLMLVTVRPRQQRRGRQVVASRMFDPPAQGGRRAVGLVDSDDDAVHVVEHALGPGRGTGTYVRFAPRRQTSGLWSLATEPGAAHGVDMRCREVARCVNPTSVSATRSERRSRRCRICSRHPSPTDDGHGRRRWLRSHHPVGRRRGRRPSIGVVAMVAGLSTEEPAVGAIAFVLVVAGRHGRPGE